MLEQKVMEDIDSKESGTMSQDESRRATETISTADGHMIKARKLGHRHPDAFEAAMTLKPKAPQPVQQTPLPPGSGTQASSHVTQEEDQEQPEEEGSITESSSREAQQQPRSTTAAGRDSVLQAYRFAQKYFRQVTKQKGQKGHDDEQQEPAGIWVCPGCSLEWDMGTLMCSVCVKLGSPEGRHSASLFRSYQ